MPARTFVSELLKISQSEISKSKGEDFSAKEQGAMKIGRFVAQLCLSEMLVVDGDEPISIRCSCGGAARGKEKKVAV